MSKKIIFTFIFLSISNIFYAAIDESINKLHERYNIIRFQYLKMRDRLKKFEDDFSECKKSLTKEQMVRIGYIKGNLSVRSFDTMEELFDRIFGEDDTIDYDLYEVSLADINKYLMLYRTSVSKLDDVLCTLKIELGSYMTTNNLTRKIDET